MSNRPPGMLLWLAMLASPALQPGLCQEEPVERQALAPERFEGALPDSTTLFLETLSVRSLLKAAALLPAAKLWNAEAWQAWWREHCRKELKEEDLRVLKSAGQLLAALDGQAALVLGGPDWIDAKASSPPLLLAVEARPSPARLKEVVLEFRKSLGVEVLKERLDGPIRIEEDGETQLAFTEHSACLSFLPAATAAWLQGLRTPPERPLSPQVTRARALLSAADLSVHAAYAGFLKLAKHDFFLSAAHIKFLKGLGLEEGSSLDGAVRLAEQGVEERYQIRRLRAQGLLALLGAVPPGGAEPLLEAPLPLADVVDGAAEAAPPRAPEERADLERPAGPAQAAALDALPVQTSCWVSLRGTLSARATPLAKALRELDRKADPHLLRLEKLTGAPLEKFIEQIQGALELGILYQAVGAERPAEFPIRLLASVLVKDPEPIRRALERAASQAEGGVGR